MSTDTYAEVTRRSWFQRMGNAFAGIVFGVVLLVGSFVLLFWNEGRTIRRQRALKEGLATVITVSAEHPNPLNDGKLVHLTAKAVTNAPIEDQLFGVSTDGLRLRREVEMFQWDEEEKSETRKKLGGGEETVTTYSYNKVWSNRHISSAGFKKQAGHENPAGMPFESQTFSARLVSVGGFTLSEPLIEQIGDYEDLLLNRDHTMQTVPEAFGVSGTVSGEGLYYGRSAAAPAVGDVRVRFKFVPQGMVSVVAGQMGRNLGAYRTSNGQVLELLGSGIQSANEMFAGAEKQNNLMKWLLRMGGFVMMFIGFSLILKPLSVIADFVPLIGSLVGAGAGFAALCMSIVLSLTTIAVAWLFFRPLMAVILLGLAAVPIVFLLRRSKRMGPPLPNAAGTPPPPPH